MTTLSNILNELAMELIKETQSKFPPTTNDNFANELINFKNKKIDQYIAIIREEIIR